MTKILKLTCIAFICLLLNGCDKRPYEDKDTTKAFIENRQKDLNNSRLLVKTAEEAVKKAIEEERALDFKKRESFKNGERLFCKNQIVSSINGWSLDGDLLIKDDRYYSLADCFLKSK